jgi:hypothetical protein
MPTPVEFYLLFKRKFAIDKTVTFATLTSITPMITGSVTVLLVAIYFSPELQGYYYTFGSLTALQFLLEMGLGQAVIQFASHEWAYLQLNSQGEIIGDPDSLSRLVSLSRQTFKWYVVLAVFVAVILSATGLIFFSKSTESGIQWVGPWLSLCLCASLNLVLMPIFYLLQGCNQVTEFWFYRFIQQILNGLCLWSAIYMGAKLWTAPAAGAVGLLWSIFFLWYKYRKFVLTVLFSTCGRSIINWRKEVWPVQWKIAICWFSVYFTPQLFVPMLFKLSGPVTAGQMGIIVTIGGVILGLSSNWVVTKAPAFGILIAKRRFDELDLLFFKSLKVSLVVAILSSVTIFCAILMLNFMDHPFAIRVLPPYPSGLYFCSSLITIACVNLSTYLRAHKKEPLAVVYLLSTASIVIVTYLLCSKFGAMGISSGYLLVLSLIQLPLTIFVFIRSRAVWH